MGLPLRILFIAIPEEDAAPLLDELRQGGFDPVWHEVDSLVALEEALQQPWDVLVADYSERVPISGITAAMRDRSLDIPLLVVSGNTSYEALIEAIHAGAQDYVPRGSLGHLVLAVRRELLAASQRAEQRELVVTDYLLQEIDQLILQGYDLVPLVNRICERLVELFDFRLVWIGMKQEDGAVNVIASAGTVSYLEDIDVRWDDTSQGQETTGQAIRSGRPILLVRESHESAVWRERAEPLGMRSHLALPLGTQGKVIGALMLYSGRADAFGEMELKRLSSFASRITVAMLVAQEQQQLRLLSAAMNHAPNAIYIIRLDGTIEWLNEALTVFSGYSATEILGSKPDMFHSGEHDAAFWNEMWQTLMAGKVWRGDVTNRHKTGYLYTVTMNISPLFDNAGELTHFLVIQQDISEKKKLEQEIQHLAYHDTLTGLPNRAMFQDRLEMAIAQARRSQAKLALLFLDLDGFKEVNDGYGHAVGDSLLQIVANRLKDCIRAGDTVARLGGDEFTLLLRDVNGADDAVTVAEKLLKSVGQPCDMGNCVARVTASIGISLYPSDGEDADTLLKHADRAMYRAKEGGASRFEFFNPA